MGKIKYKKSDIINLSNEDIMKLKEKDLRTLVSQGGSIVRNQIKRLKLQVEEQNLPTPIALKEWGSISVSTSDKLKKYKIIDKKDKSTSYEDLNLYLSKDDTVNSLRYKFKYIRNFLNSKTSTVTGWKNEVLKFYNRIYDEDFKSLKEIGNKFKLSSNQYSELFRIYEQVKKHTVLSNLQSSEQQRVIYDLMVRENMSFEDIKSFLLNEDAIETQIELEEKDWYTYGNND